MLGAGIRGLVIVKLDEHSAFLSSPTLGGPILSAGSVLSEVKSVYSYIDAQLSEAANEVLLSVPIHKLYATVVQTPTSTDNGNGTGYIALPSDFLRLHTLKMKEWSRPVHVAISVDHPLYPLQWSEYTRGHQHKPVVVYDGENNQETLTYFSVEKDHTIDKLSYISEFDTKAEYNDTVAELIALNCAKKVLEVYGNTEQVTLITSEIKNVQDNMLL